MNDQDVKLKKTPDGRVALALHGRLWTTTIRRVAELKAEQLRDMGYEAQPGDKYPFVVYITKTPKQ